MAHLIIGASKAYKEKTAILGSELKAPRKIIKMVILGQIVEIFLLLYLIFWR